MLSRRYFFKTAVACALLSSRGADAVAAMSKTSLPQLDLGFIASKISLKKRSAWTALNPKPWILKPSRGFDAITIHHSGAGFDQKADEEIIISSIETMCLDHKTRGYGDIGYHFVLDPSGNVWEARSLAYEGAHVAGNNEGNVGIVLPGNFDQQEPSAKQKVALPVLVDVLRDKYRIKIHRLFGHRDLGRSICPGDNLYDFMQTLKNK